MKKVMYLFGFIIVLLFVDANIDANISRGSLLKEGKPPINFYKNGKLMWLIDKNNNRGYRLLTIEEYKEHNLSYVESSYESYLNKINNDKRYKYTDWRVPTKDELMTLETKSGFLRRFFTLKSREKILTYGTFDKDIFYDYSDAYGYPSAKYATSDLDKENRVYTIQFWNRKYPCYFWECLNSRNGGATCCSSSGLNIGGYSIEEYFNLRLVRTRTQEEMKDDYKIYFLYGLVGVFFMFMGWRYRQDVLEWFKK